MIIHHNDNEHQYHVDNPNQKLPSTSININITLYFDEKRWILLYNLYYIFSENNRNKNITRPDFAMQQISSGLSGIRSIVQ
jgi:hypothetical protein